MHPGSQPPSDDTAFIIFLGIAFLIVGIIYIMPSIVAFRRNHPNRWLILVINIAFGGTVVGWESRWSGRCGRLTGLALQAAAGNPALISSSTT